MTTQTNIKIENIVVKESASSKGTMFDFKQIANQVNSQKNKTSTGFIKNIYYRVFKNSIILF